MSNLYIYTKIRRLSWFPMQNIMMNHEKTLLGVGRDGDVSGEFRRCDRPHTMENRLTFFLSEAGLRLGSKACSAMEFLRCSNSILSRSALLARKKHNKRICKGNGYLDPNDDRCRRYRTCFACRDFERVAKSHARARTLAKANLKIDMCYPVREASADMSCVYRVRW